METGYINHLSEWILETDNGNSTPTYLLARWYGNSPIMEKKGRKERQYIYLKPNYSSRKEETPAINIQGIGGLNLTGLRWLIEDGWKLQQRVAYGEAGQRKTLSNGKANYMYPHRADAYLFQFGDYVPYKQTDGLIYVPSFIRLIIIDKGRLLAKEYCKSLSIGLFDDDIKRLLEQGNIKDFSLYNKVKNASNLTL